MSRATARAAATLAVLTAAWLGAHGPAPSPAAVSGAAPPTRRPEPRGLPVAFAANRGQWAPEVRFGAAIGGGALFVTDDGLTLVHAEGAPAVAVPGADVAPAAGASITRLRFDSAAPAVTVLPGRRLPGVAHFLRGGDARRWVTHVPTFAGVTLRGVSPGVDLHVDGRGGSVALALAVAPRGDPAAIRWRVVDGEGRPVAGAGIHFGLGTSDGHRVGPAGAGPVIAADAMAGGRSWVALGGPAMPGRRVGGIGGAGNLDTGAPAEARRAPDHTGAASPRLVYSTYLGGRFSDLIRGLAVDAEGFAYVAGTTTSLDYPTAGALQPALGNSGSLQDAFVAKLDPTGTRLVYSTFLGGNRQDEAFGLAVDRVGRAHVTGYTLSPDFPTHNPLQPAIHLADGIFSGDTFIAKLTPDGGGLEFGTFFGGTARDVGKGIAVDAAGFVYTTGWTGSNFPAFNAIYPLNRGVRDAFIVKLAPAGDRVVYSTHLGGSYADDAKRIAVDGAGNAYVVGTTASLNLRVVAPFQRVIAGESDAFVAKVLPDGSAFGYATYFGGRGDERGIDIAVNPAGEAYVLGQTDSPNLPRQRPLQATRGGDTDLFVARFTAAGDALVFGTYLGGSGGEGDCVQPENFRDLATATPDARGTRYLEGSKFTDGPVGGIALDAAGRVHVASCTSSGNLPLVNPLQTRRIGGFDLVLGVLAPEGDRLVFGTYLGGRPMNAARALAVGGDGGIFVAGQTDATDFPLAPAAGPLQGARSGTDDAFVLKIGDALEEAPTTTPPGPTDTAEPTETPVPGDTATATGTATASGTATAPAAGTATATGTATDAVEPTSTARATASATAVAGSPTAAATAAATATPTPMSRAGTVFLPWAVRE
ncbi:hypothetical protein DCC79_05755 [bacterium]|nr:MAG: hypothetical protein DCC79_05755 [bacterium]